jgi:hypothetical protein
MLIWNCIEKQSRHISLTYSNSTGTASGILEFTIHGNLRNLLLWIEHKVFCKGIFTQIIAKTLDSFLSLKIEIRQDLLLIRQ